MAYYVDLFSRETLARFVQSDQTITGFRLGHRRAAERVRPGDKFICYLTKASRWVAILEVEDGPFEDHSPRFAEEDDPFVIRFHVRPVVMLTEEEALPIKDERVWRTLSFTRDHEPTSKTWTGRLRGSLNRLDEADGEFLEELLLRRASSTEVVDKPDDLDSHTPISRSDDIVEGEASGQRSLGGGSESGPSTTPATEERESIRIQAKLAEVGARILGGMDIWIPANDRSRVERHLPEGGARLITRLPLNYNEDTNKTIEQIDVLWLRNRSIARAFEVEHTTAVYSGLLRMADLLALQPNMDIRLYIVAPSERRSKVFQEIRRPAFSGFGLADRCAFLSYESVAKLHEHPDIEYLSDAFLERYEERVPPE